MRRACGRHERLQAERLDGRRPTYKLDHLIRERYPTFADALQVQLHLPRTNGTTACCEPQCRRSYSGEGGNSESSVR